MRKFFILVLIMLVCSPTFSEGLGREIYINRVFAEGSSTAGFYGQDGIPECKWGLMYIDLSSDTGKALFTLALAAKMTAQPVVRIDYTLNPSGTCSADAIHTM